MGQIAGRRRRRWPYILSALLLVIVAVLVAGDYAARRAAENAIATRVQRSTGSDGASVTIHSFPFLYDTVEEGRVSSISITDRGVPAGPFRIDQVRLVADRVHFARRQLLIDHKVDITAVERATITVTTHLSALEALALSTLTADLPRIAIVPTCPLVVTHAGDEYSFTCTVSPVPAGVLAVLR